MLLLVALTDHPTWRWQRNPRVFGGGHVRRDLLAHNEGYVVPVVFFDEFDQEQTPPHNSRVGSLLRFTDEDGVRWEVGEGDPREVPVDDADLGEA